MTDRAARSRSLFITDTPLLSQPGANSISLNLGDANKGFLPNRVTTTQRNAIVNPPNGLMVYNTTVNEHQYFKTGTGWTSLGAPPPDPTAQYLYNTSETISLVLGGPSSNILTTQTVYLTNIIGVPGNSIGMQIADGQVLGQRRAFTFLNSDGRAVAFSNQQIFDATNTYYSVVRFTTGGNTIVLEWRGANNGWLIIANDGCTLLV